MAKVCKLADFGKVLKNELEKTQKQMKYAASRAINRAAFKVREDLQKEYREVFTVRSQNLPKMINIQKKATKQDLSATIGMDKKFNWLAVQTTGGTRLPKNVSKTKSLSTTPIPVGEKMEVNRNSSGKMRPSMNPGSLLKYGDQNRRKRKNKVQNPHAFKMTLKNGLQVIAKRDKSDRSKIDVMYYRVPKVKIEKRWDFDAVAKKSFEKNFPKFYDEEFEKAMRTAK